MLSRNHLFADELMALIGNEIAKMHLADVIHGDLTTSNMMLRHPESSNTTAAELVRLSKSHLVGTDLLHRC